MTVLMADIGLFQVIEKTKNQCFLHYHKAFVTILLIISQGILYHRKFHRLYILVFPQDLGRRDGYF